MNCNVLLKAQSRLRVLQSAVHDIENSKTYSEFCDAWYTFLVASKNIYTVLGNGAKATQESRQWFGAKNKERKQDPLLRYVIEARNDDEHGIEFSTEYAPPELALGVKKPGSSSHMVDEFGNTFHNCLGTFWTFQGTMPAKIPEIRSLDGKPVYSEYRPATAKLRRVHDRSGNPYDPPKTHLGKNLPDGSPLTVAKLMGEYLAKLIAEAEGFHKP